MKEAKYSPSSWHEEVKESSTLLESEERENKALDTKLVKGQGSLSAVSEVPSYSMDFTSDSMVNRELVEDEGKQLSLSESVKEDLSQHVSRSESVSSISSLSSESPLRTSPRDQPEDVDIDDTLTEDRLKKVLGTDEGLGRVPELKEDDLFSSIEEDFLENDLSAEIGSDLGRGIDDLEPHFQQKEDQIQNEDEENTEESEEEKFELQDGRREEFANEDSLEFQEEERGTIEEYQQEEIEEDHEVEQVPHFQFGDEVIVSGKVPGIVRFVGRTKFADGTWVGIEIFEPKGLNDGSIEGTRYFDAPPKCGVFAPPNRVVLMSEEEKMELYKEEYEEDQEAIQEEDMLGKEDGVEENMDEEGKEEGLVEEKDEDVEGEAGRNQKIGMEEEHEEWVQNEDLPLNQNENEELVGNEDQEIIKDVQPKAEDEDEDIIEEIEEEVYDEDDSLEKEEIEREKLDEEKTDNGIVDGTPVGDSPLQVTSVVPCVEGQEPRLPDKENENTLEETKQPEVVEPQQNQEDSKKQDNLKKATLGKKADAVTDALFSLLLKSEFNLAYDIRASRRVSAAAEETVEDEAVVEMSGGNVLSSINEQPSDNLEHSPSPTESSPSHYLTPASMTAEPTLPNLPPPPPITAETFPYENGLLPEEMYAHIEAIDAQFMAELKSTTSASALSEINERPLTTSVGSPKEDLQTEHAPEVNKDSPVLTPASMTSTPTLPNLPPPPPITPETFPYENGLLPEEMYARIEAADAQFVASLKSKTSAQPSSLNDKPVSTLSGSPPLSPTTSSVNRPGSLSESTVARLFAGEKSPPPTSPPPQTTSSPAASNLERTTSVDSLANMLASIKVTSAQCMVPSKREIVDNIVAHAWQEAMRVGVDKVGTLKEVGEHLPPREMLKMARKAVGNLGEDLDFDEDEDDLGPTELECREAYVELVFQLSLEMIETLHPKKVEKPVWARESATRVLLVPHLFPNYDPPTMEDVQKRVYASLMRTRVPEKLPNLKFLHKNKRPGRKDIDTVDQMLIQELRREEPEWVDYCQDEQDIKIQVADSLLESLLLETAMVTKEIMEKKEKSRLKEARCN